MPNQYSYHESAAGLIVAAAEKSGLLEEVAEALCFIDKHPNPAGDCRACELLDQLAEEFDAHTCLPGTVIEGFHGDGIAIGPFTETELAPYLATASKIDQNQKESS
jgi:hypothetical protein